MGTLPAHLLAGTGIPERETLAVKNGSAQGSPGKENEQKIEPGRCDSRRRTVVPHWRTDWTASLCGNEELGGKSKAWRRVYRVEGKSDRVEQKPNEEG
jgi:hypothetical protein